MGFNGFSSLKMSDNQISRFFNILSELEKPLRNFFELNKNSAKNFQKNSGIVKNEENTMNSFKNFQETNEKDIIETYEDCLRGFKYESIINDDGEKKYKIIENFNERKIKPEGFLKKSFYLFISMIERQRIAVEVGKLLKINKLEDDFVLKKHKNMNFFEKIKTIVQQKQKNNENKLKKEQEIIVQEEEKLQFEVNLDTMKVEKKMEFTKKNREFLYF